VSTGPVACAPQAWAAGSVFLLLQACLGLGVDAMRPADRVRSLTIDPPAPGRIRLVDLALVNHAHDVGVYLAARDGDVGVVIMK